MFEYPQSTVNSLRNPSLVLCSRTAFEAAPLVDAVDTAIITSRLNEKRLTLQTMLQRRLNLVHRTLEP